MHVHCHEKNILPSLLSLVGPRWGKERACARLCHCVGPSYAMACVTSCSCINLTCPAQIQSSLWPTLRLRWRLRQASPPMLSLCNTPDYTTTLGCTVLLVLSLPRLTVMVHWCWRSFRGGPGKKWAGYKWVTGATTTGLSRSTNSQTFS